jgi:hypothetical protein
MEPDEAVDEFPAVLFVLLDDSGVDVTSPFDRSSIEPAELIESVESVDSVNSVEWFDPSIVETLFSSLPLTMLLDMSSGFGLHAAKLPAAMHTTKKYAQVTNNFFSIFPPRQQFVFS